jgi:putative membrane-bound dehydrogenase-like protein
MSIQISRLTDARTSLKILGLLGVAVSLSAAAPLTNTGTCPTLTRESASWLQWSASGNASSSQPRAVYDRFISGKDTTQFNVVLARNSGTMQSPLTAAQSINCLGTIPGFRAELWASEADSVISVQNFTFDERGRMWAVETFDYPNTLTTPFAGHDRVVILEDTNHDGVMDSRKIFVSGLNIPQAIEIVPQGIVVGMTPHIVLFKDENNDDVADSPTGTVLYTGFPRSNDTHGGLHQLKYGLDGWLYGSTGYNGGNVSGVAVGQSIFRVRTDTTRIERISGINSSNAAGLGQMEDGQLFASAANAGTTPHTQHAVTPGATTTIANANISAYSTNNIPDSTNDKVQGDYPWSYSAATGHEIYTARLFPQEYWNRASFINEPTGHVLPTDFLVRNNSSWRANRVTGKAHILASKDAWAAPLQSMVGPDGTLWVIDWYTYVLLHNGINGSWAGAGAAWINPLRTRTRERIYRVVPSDNRLDPVLNLSNATFPQLVETFRNTNMFWRLQAQKMILRKANTPQLKADVEPLLLNALKSRSVDAVGLDPYALHAMWTAQGLGLFNTNAAKWDSVLRVLSLHPSYAVRMNVAKAMPRTAASVLSIKTQGRVNDSDAHVRLWTLLALAQMPQLAGIEMWDTYRTTDSYSTSSFTRANNNGSGITAVAEMPVVPPLEPPSAVTPRPYAALGAGPRFIMTPSGWQPRADKGLVPGTLSIYDVRGSLVGRVAFDGLNWSSGLNIGHEPVYVFTYQGRTGARYQGKLTPASGY